MALNWGNVKNQIAVPSEQDRVNTLLASGNPKDVMAGIYRAQWQDYSTRFIPLEDELIATYDNPQVHARIMGEATAKTAGAFDAAQGSYQRTMARGGMAQDGMVQQESERAFGLGRTLALADTQNRTRRALVEWDQGILAGGMTTGAKNFGGGA